MKKTPMNTPGYVTDLWLRHVVLTRQLALRKSTRCVLFTDLKHLAGRQLAIATMSPLAHAIAIVVSLCAQKQMGWIATNRVVATMADTDSGRGLTKCEISRQSVCETDDARSFGELPASTAVNGARPRPARFWTTRSINPFMEAIV